MSGEGLGGFHEDFSQEMSQALSSFNNNETVFHGDNLVAQPNRVGTTRPGRRETILIGCVCSLNRPNMLFL